MYECGACGGNNVLLNARFAAILMNDTAIQTLIQEKYGYERATFFSAQHNTTLATLEFDPFFKDKFESDASSTLISLAGELSCLPKRRFPTSDTFTDIQGQKNGTGHVPIRLQIFIAAPWEKINQAVELSALAPAVAGGWITIHSLADVVAMAV